MYAWVMEVCDNNLAVIRIAATVQRMYSADDMGLVLVCNLPLPDGSAVDEALSRCDWLTLALWTSALKRERGSDLTQQRRPSEDRRRRDDQSEIRHLPRRPTTSDSL